MQCIYDGPTENLVSANGESVDSVETSKALIFETIPKSTIPVTSDTTKKISPTSRANPLGGLESVRLVAGKLISRFFPRDELENLLCQLVIQNGLIPSSEAFTATQKLIEDCFSHFESSDEEWKLRLSGIFGGRYPRVAREVWVDGRLGHRHYGRRSKPESESPVTFSVTTYEPRISPRIRLTKKLAPRLYAVRASDKGAPRVVTTENVERFLAGESGSLLESSLYEVQIFNRPTYRVNACWSLEPNRLPCKQVAAEITSKEGDRGLLHELAEDLKSTFSLKNESSLPVYLGYLLQPMLCHMLPGQMPAYFLGGPTKSGKNYLSCVLPGVIYSRDGAKTVLTKTIPDSSYEMEVYLNDIREALFVVFDEIIHASDEQFAFINSLLTQPTIQVRRFREGYLKIENRFTFAMTAVNRGFSDETDGRLAVISLERSRPDEITSFHRRWMSRGPQLLHALFTSLNEVDLELSRISAVPDRRPGFGLMARAVHSVFGIKPSYELHSTAHEVLDDLCRLYEERKNKGSEKGQWTRFSVRAIQEFWQELGIRISGRARIIKLLQTALAYGSTRHHPVYKESGYQAESERHYHIEMRTEGQDSTSRIFIYIRPAEQPGEREFLANMQLLVHQEAERTELLFNSGELFELE